MANSTKTLLNTIEWAKTFNFGRRSALGNYLEPALTSANIVMQTILGPPFEWRWNRKQYAWTMADKTTVWQANYAYPINSFLIDSNGNLQRVTSIGVAPHQSGVTVPVWSTDTANLGTTTDNNLTWTVSDPQTYYIPCTDFGWIENFNVYDPTDKRWIEVQPKLSLALDSSVARPRNVSAYGDDGNGNIGFTFMPVPDKAYPCNVQIQKKAPLFTSVNQVWSPIPDEYSYIYNWGFLAMMWLFADDPRFSMANQKFVASLLGANEGLTETERNIFLANWDNLTSSDQNRQVQGTQARGV